MKRTVWIVVGIVVIALSGLSIYYYLDAQTKQEEYNGIFVDRSEDNGYATMYHLPKGL